MQVCLFLQKDLKVTVDFLIPPAPGLAKDQRIQNLEPDFAALVTRGLGLAFDEKRDIELDGHTLAGETARRTIPVCGPGAFVVLKALAFGDRAEPKDAYDLLYVIRRSPGHAEAIAERLGTHAENDLESVRLALDLPLPTRQSSTIRQPTPRATSMIC